MYIIIITYNDVVFYRMYDIMFLSDEGEETVVKKIIAVLLLVLMSATVLCGCGTDEKIHIDVNGSSSGDVADDGVIHVNDSNYMTVYTNISSNPDAYAGRKIDVSAMYYETEYEGTITPRIYRKHLETDPEDGKEYAYYRGYILEASTEIKYDRDTWLHVVGTVEAEKHEDHAHISIIVESIETLGTPEAEYVE